MLPKRHCKEKRSYGMLREIKWQYSSLGNELVWEIQIYSHRNFGLNWSKMISTILTSFSYFPIIYPFTSFFFFFATMGWKHDYHCMSLSSTDTTNLIKIVFLKNGLQNAPILTKDIRYYNVQTRIKATVRWTLPLEP